MVCRGCGAISDVDCAVGEAPCLEPSAAHGFVIDEAEVTFWGLCPACQESDPGLLTLDTAVARRMARWTG